METVGFARSTAFTPSRNPADPARDFAQPWRLVGVVENLRICAAEAYHPLLLSIFILSRHLSSDTNELRHREARKGLSGIEHAIGGRLDVAGGSRPYLLPDGTRKLDKLNEVITETYASVLWNPAPNNRRVIGRMNDLAQCFWERLAPERKTTEVKRLHTRILERLAFHSARLDNIEAFADTSLKRLEAQRNTVTKP